jgi:hypothetical protein
LGEVADLLATTVIALWLALALHAYVGLRLYCARLGFSPHAVAKPPVAVIVPVRGTLSDLPALWNALRAQRYPRFRVLFAVESRADPAYAALKKLVARARSPSASIVVAGLARDQGQKTRNQLAAMAELRRGDRIVVFADADIQPSPDWLLQIVDLLGTRSAMLVSGYRWMVPADRELATAVGCAINNAVASIPRIGLVALAWGGTMAAWHETLIRIEARRYLEGSVADDLQLTRAAAEHGGNVETPPFMLLRTRAAFNWRTLAEFVRRQYVLIRIYASGHWWLAALAALAPIVGWCVAIPLVWAGDLRAIVALVAAPILHQLRASLRAQIPRKVWGMEPDHRIVLIDRLAAPLVLIGHAALVWSTLFGRTIRWGGRTYRIDGPQNVRILRGPDGKQ